MNTIEERLWSYIDGTCSGEERKAIDLLIANDEAYRAKFEELLSFDQELTKMESEEPSMGFTYKVMEGIRAEHAQQPLRAGINPRIIKSIAWFFIITIVSMTIYMFATVRVGHATLPPNLTHSLRLPQSIHLSVLSQYISGSTLLKVFFFIDVVLALFLADGYFRRKRGSKHALKH